MEWQVSLWGMRHWDPLRHVLLGVTLWGDIATGKACFQSHDKNNVVMSTRWDWVYFGKSESWRWWYTCTQTPGWIQNLDDQWGETVSVLMSFRGEGLWSAFYVYMGR